MGYEGAYPWQGSNLHSTVFETAASANWATGAHGASGGQRSRNLRDVNAALCRLSYAGLVGSGGIEPPSPVYQTGALSHCATIRKSARRDSNSGRLVISKLLSPLSYGPYNIGGPERIRTSTATRRFYRALGSLMPSRPVGWCCFRDSNPDHLLGRQARLSVTPKQPVVPPVGLEPTTV